MSLTAKVRRAPLRAVTGAYILNSGIGKLTADDETAAGLQQFAAGTYPIAAKVKPKLFARALGAIEVTLGVALLTPVVPAAAAGAGLAAFSGGLLNMWFHTPGMRAEGSIRPTQQGTAIAKDSWMFGIGASLVLDSVLDSVGSNRAARQAQHKLAHAERQVSALERKAAREQAKHLQG